MKFNTNQIVKGIRAGYFVVLGYREVAGETLVQVKLYNPDTGEVGYGEMAFPEDCLKPVY